jgi:hypothetical protein
VTVAVDTMMRRDVWRALNVLSVLQRGAGPGRLVTARQLLDRHDLEPDALVWLDDELLIEATSPAVAGPIGFWSVVNPPGDIHRPGSPYEPGRVYVALTRAGREWLGSNPYQRTLAAAHYSRGRTKLHRLVAQHSLDAATLNPLEDAGLILLINQHGITLRPGQGPIHASKEDMRTCVAKSSAEGRRILGVTG